MASQVLIRGALAGVAIYALSGLLITARADLPAPPPLSPSIYATHAGITLTGNDVVQGEEFSVRTSAWKLETAPWIWSLEEINVPADRAIWILFRGSRIEQTFDGTPELGENYAFAHHALNGNATTTLNTNFDMPMLGDPDTPSGHYTLLVAELPETYFIFDEDIGDYVGERPYTTQDFVNWIARIDNFAEPNHYRSIEFDYVAGEAPAGAPDPVIIIPGILGSEQHNGEWVIDPILHTYDDLIATLDENGYTPDEDLFPFPYNWRKSNVETAELLKGKIDEVKEICECDKVDLVAHSMGGLVARQYIQSDEYEDDVDQLIFLGTPHLGAPKAYSIWEAGEYTPTILPIEDSLLERMLKQEAKINRYPGLFEYIRNKPILSVRELLPVYDYIFDNSSLRSYPANYPRNTFLENLNNRVAQLLDSGVKVSNIIGETGANDTIIGIQSTNPAVFLPKWEHGYPDGFSSTFGNHGLIRGQGDGTVPFNSATFISENVIPTSVSHNALPNDTQAAVFKILTGEDASKIIDNINLPDLKIILFKMLSPADLLIVAPDGKKIGKNTNGQEINQIPNAFYTGFNTDTEFITILNPLDGEYKIFSQGTGSGSYTVETSLIEKATTTEASFTGETAPGIKAEINVKVDNGAIVPESVELIVTYQSTLADLDRIYALKWINAGIYKSLKAQLQSAKKSKPLVAKILLQTMLKQLNVYRGKLLTEQGYQILKADIEQLI